MEGSGAAEDGIVRRTLYYLRAHPLLLLLLLTPGIPEYLSSSSPLNSIVLNPPMFLFQLVANLGLYLPGALLVREAAVRWNKGWATVLLLGAAYGILEEGIALSTLFNPKADPVGVLGYFGHWLGVNWVWAVGVVPVHMVFSISVPILLLGLALPETRGSLLSRRGLTAAFAILAADVTALVFIVYRFENFWMGWPLFLLSFAAIGPLVYLAHRAPASILHARTTLPLKGARTMVVIGFLFYPSVLLTEFLAIDAMVPPVVVFFMIIAVQGLFLLYVTRVAGFWGNERQLVAFTFGIILPIAIGGIVAEIRLPFTLVADIAMVLFFRKLWRRCAPDVSRTELVVL